MKTISVSTGVSYDILIEKGLIEKSGELIKPLFPSAARAMIITDSNVAPLYSKGLKASLSACGYEVFEEIIPAGEEHKTFLTVQKLLNRLSESLLGRKDFVIALGGGVTGDLAGFASAIYLRGIDFVQIPTTLLAQIDSSVGGKTGCDLPAGKNLAGAFHQPKLVIIDPNVLSTLPEYYFTDGMAEAIKYGCIFSEALFEKLLNNRITPTHEYLEEMIEVCVKLKRDVVERDEKEAGDRILLNFGHTLGHALEKYYDFTGISHGRAIGIGMVLVAKGSELEGTAKAGTARRIEDALIKYGLPVSDNAPLDKLCEFAASDKKRRGDSVKLVLVDKIGHSYTKSVKAEKLKNYLEEGTL